MRMNRREFAFAGLAAAVSGPGSRYRIVDAQIHVWINDPHYPWAAGTKNPPRENRTPAMALELMKANGVERTVIAQYIGYKWPPAIAVTLVATICSGRWSVVSAVAQLASVVVAHGPQAAVALEKQAVVVSCGNRRDIAGHNLLGPVGLL